MTEAAMTAKVVGKPLWDEARSRLRILLVEDSPPDADLVKGLLAVSSRLRCELSTAETLAKALKRLGRGGIELVLTDLNLPDSSGLDTALKLRAAAPLLPIIVLSGSAEKETALAAVREGAQDYLIKADVDGRLLDRSIHYALERQRLLCELDRRYQQEHQLVELKSRLVSVVSHEFANALSVIQCALPLLSDGAGEPRRVESVFQILDKNVRSLRLTATNLLNMGRLEADKFTLTVRKTELSGLLEDSLRSLEVLSQSKTLRTSLQLPSEALAVAADPEAVRLVVSNLLTNAIKYTPEGGQVVLGAAPDPAGGCLVYVQDTGIGISRKDQRLLFREYFRAEDGRKTATGFGVGLAFAAAVLEAQDSALRVKSAPGKGSRFYFTLPGWGDRPDAQRWVKTVGCGPSSRPLTQA